MAPIDIADLTASWISVLVTALGLCTLIAQAGVIRMHLDPFYRARDPQQLGSWAKGDSLITSISKLAFSRPLLGPSISGSLRGFCNLNEVYMTRIPTGKQGRDYGTTTWTKISHVLHPSEVSLQQPLQRAVSLETKSKAAPARGDIEMGKEAVSYHEEMELGPRHQLNQHVNRVWQLPRHELVSHEQRACIKISRVTFMVLLAVSNAYQCYLHNGDSGLRAMFSGYTGSWQVVWPIGRPAVLEFLGLDLDANTQDNFPINFKRRVDKCLLMLLGMISGGAIGSIGFPDVNDESHRSVLEFYKGGGYPGDPRSHLYLLLGGKSFEADYIARRSISEHEHPPKDSLPLMVPVPHLDFNRKPTERRTSLPEPVVTVFVPPRVQEVLALSLDCLPWSLLSWSIHRGMQSILLAYGGKVMTAYRRALANTLRRAARQHADELVRKGYASSFVRTLDNIVYSRILQERGDSGDGVRIVTDIAMTLCEGMNETALDETKFWRRNLGEDRKPIEAIDAEAILDQDTVVALVKFWVLEWSHELDHRVYEILPFELLVA